MPCRTSPVLQRVFERLPPFNPKGVHLTSRFFLCRIRSSYPSTRMPWRSDHTLHHEASSYETWFSRFDKSMGLICLNYDRQSDVMVAIPCCMCETRLVIYFWMSSFCCFLQFPDRKLIQKEFFFLYHRHKPGSFLYFGRKKKKRLWIPVRRPGWGCPDGDDLEKEHK